MKQLYKLLLISIFFYRELSAVAAWKKQMSNSHHTSDINQMAVEILKNCYADFKTIVIYGDFETSTIESLESIQSFAVIFTNSSIINVAPNHRSKLNLYLMSTDSNEQLRKLLLTFEYSPWWNVMGTFFILDKSNGGCENAPAILETAWNMNVVISLFLCLQSGDIPMVYTSNPYGNYATPFWRKIPSLVKHYDHLSIYARPYHAENICKGFKFVRTKHLNGARVKAVIPLPKSEKWIANENYNESMIEKIYDFEAFMTKTMKYSLNVTFVLNVEEASITTNDKPQGIYKRLHNKSSDVALCLRTRYDAHHVTTTYPVIYSKYYIATNNRGYYTPLEKIEKFYGMITLVSMSIILTITFIVIVLYGKKRRWAFAIFEILRLIVNTALRSQMKLVSIRIFFVMIFLYFLIIHATFQGHLLAFLTTAEYRSNVESLLDLRDSKYKEIYVTPAIASHITDPLLKKKLILGHSQCAPRIVGKDSAACITDIVFLLKEAFDNNLHLSKESVNTHVYILPVRNDWPLKERFDIFFMWVEQSGIFNHLYNTLLESEITRQKIIMGKFGVKFRPVSLSMVSFAFDILALGLALGIVVFIIEKVIKCNALYLRNIIDF